MFGRIGLIALTAVATLAVGVACGGSASPAAVKPPAGVTTNVLASGRLEAIPAGTLFVNYLKLPQASAGSIKHKHLAGFVYAVAGTVEIDVDGASPLIVQPGQAAFIGANVMHNHLNSGAVANDWWFVALRPAASRPLATIVSGQKELYTTGDLTQINAGPYTETLSDNVLPANGVDRQSGQSLRVLYVLDGDVTVSGDAAMVGTVSTGQGAYSLPGANLVITAGSKGGHYLIFTLTPAN
ncbi:MAG: cupin domain-containing protein [Chloroflexi bacterium]|nr:MAG: cupin domain-containing protein [Chloroflexota bacterium]